MGKLFGWRSGVFLGVLAVVLALGLYGVALGADAASGKAVYERNTCSACHSSEGDGGIGPPLKGADFVQKYANPDQMVSLIRTGKGTMPGFSEERIDKTQMDNLVTYILGLSKSSGGAPAGANAADGSKAEAQQVHYGPFTSFDQIYGLAVLCAGLVVMAFFALILNGPLKMRR